MDSIVVRSTSVSPSRTWTVSRSLLCNASKMAERVLQENAVKTFSIPIFAAARVELFLQWLYLGSYQEQDVPMFLLSREGLPARYSRTSSSMNWSMTAAVLAHHLGRYIEAPWFQNYAMVKLVQAYDAAEPRVMITPDVLTNTSPSPLLNMFFEDILMRNWGDKSVIHHEHGVWSKVFEREELKERLVQAMAIPLKERRGEPMVLEKYLVEEE